MKLPIIILLLLGKAFCQVTQYCYNICLERWNLCVRTVRDNYACTQDTPVCESDCDLWYPQQENVAPITTWFEACKTSCDSVYVTCVTGNSHSCYKNWQGCGRFCTNEMPNAVDNTQADGT